MARGRLSALHWLALAFVYGLAVGPGLGAWSYLSYHEAIWAQNACEMLSNSDFLIPTLNQEPWLEKPPISSWLISVSACVTGRVSPTAARLPSAIAGFALVLAVSTFGGREFGPRIGLLAGSVQATTLWTVIRSRLAEADIVLACFTTWALVAFDGMRRAGSSQRRWRLTFYIFLGMTALAKGIGFGAVLVFATALLALAWDRDKAGIRTLCYPLGWAVTALVALAWPLVVLAQYPKAMELWTLHITDRIATRPHEFIGEPWWVYASSVLWQTLPWAPFSFRGARGSLRACFLEGDERSKHRFLWVWALTPAVLVSLASVRNAHYLIYALPPWAIWAAIRLDAFTEWLCDRGWSWRKVCGIIGGLFVGVAATYGIGFSVLGPRIDHRGTEWAFYESLDRYLVRNETVLLLYDDWDRRPYPNTIGKPVPHDLAVRLYYLKRPVLWFKDVNALAKKVAAGPGHSIPVIVRQRDLMELERIGNVNILANGPTVRRDRAFLLVRVRPNRQQQLTVSSVKNRRQ